MKKILIIAILILTAISNVCFAKPSKFQPPDSSRWMNFAQTDQYIMWIHTKSIKFGKENKKSSDCYNHRTADVWSLYYFPETDVEMKNLEHWDLDCQTMQPISSTYKYFKKDYFSNKNRSHEPKIHVIPDTLSEGIYLLLNSLWEKNNQVNKKWIIKLCEGLPKFLRGKLEGLLIFNTEFLRVIREGLV